MTRKIVAALLTVSVVFIWGVPVAADTSIDSCGPLTLRGNGVSVDVPDGELIRMAIGGQTVFYGETLTSDPAPGEVIVTIPGRLFVETVETGYPREISADASLERTESAILVDSTARAVTVRLPLSWYSPGRQVTIKRTTAGYPVTIAAASGQGFMNPQVTIQGFIDGQPSVVLPHQWSSITLMATPRAYDDMDRWSVVARYDP